MKISVLDGKDTIGGNKILIEHKGTRIFLDFGMNFANVSKYFSEFLQPRKCGALTDFFEFGLLPDIKGIYREDYLKHMGREKEDKTVDAVFLSHAHADHAPYIHFLRKDIPIYCTEETKIILKALEETGSSTFSDFISVCDAYTLYTNSKGGLSRVTRRNEDYIYKRGFNVLKPYEKIKIGSLEVQLVPVDHSLPGACAYIIYSDEGNLVYTGDIRFHGYRRESSEKFVEIAKSVKPKWLLCEGTRIKENKIDSEDIVCKKITRRIKNTKGLVFVEHPIRDVDRAYSIYKSAKANNREFVVTLKLAYLIRELGDLCQFKLSDVKILVPPKSWGLISKEGFEEHLIKQDYDAWEQDFIDLSNKIIYKELVDNPNKYVVSMSMWEINQLVDIKPKGAVWIKSSCEPFSEDMELDEARKKNWLKHFGIKQYFAHASGHASGPDIKRLIREIHAEQVIPIHTVNPNLFD